MRETLAGGFPANALGNPIQISECLGCIFVAEYAFSAKGEKYWYYNHAHRHYNYENSSPTRKKSPNP
ncbi:MAG: hypothetical protein ACLUKN_06675 [Bacilli bacterium]